MIHHLQLQLLALQQLAEDAEDIQKVTAKVTAKATQKDTQKDTPEDIIEAIADVAEAL